MKKLLFTAAAAIVGIAASAGVNISDVQSGKGYYLRHVITGLYLNTEILQGTLPTAQEAGSLFFFTSNGTDGQYYITTGTVDSQKYVVRDPSGNAERWNGILSDTNDSNHYWVVEMGTDDNAEYAAILNPYWATQRPNSGWGWSGNANGTDGSVGTSLQTNRPENNANGRVYWEILDPDAFGSLSVTYTYNGKTIGSESISGNTGDEYTTTIPDFFTDEPITGILESGDHTLNVELTGLNLPFKFTTDKSELIWQAVHHNSNVSNYTWTYDESQPDRVTIPQVSNSSAEGYDDTMLWAFVGDYPDGFEIYNKAAGLNMPLNYQGDEESGLAKLSEATDNTVWTVVAGVAGSQASDVCSLIIPTKEGYYLDLNSNTLQWYNQHVAGSSLSFVAPATPLLNYSADCTTAVGYVGSHSEECPLTDARAAATAAPYDLDVVDALRQAIAAHEADVLEFSADVWYRLKNNQAGTYLVSGKDDNIYVWGGETSPLTNHNSIVKFIEAETTDEEVVAYNILSQGKYFGKLGAMNEQLEQVDDVADAGKYALELWSTSATDRFIIRDVETENMHSDESYGVIDCIHHDTSTSSHPIIPQVSQWNPSAWYIEVAKDVTVTLGVSEGNNYVGLGYFPFPVKTSDDDTELAYVYPAVENGTKANVLSYTTVGIVPAATPFLIRSTSNTVSLAIDYDGIAAMDDQANVLAGQLRATTAADGDYVLATTDEGAAAFVKLESDATVDGNYAYVPASALPSTHAAEASLPLLNPESTTGIIAVGVEPAAGSADIYDLQGRRLSAPAKGINIIGGTKVLVK